MKESRRYSRLKKMFPHILLHADRVKANERRNEVVAHLEEARVNEILEHIRPTDGWLQNVVTESWNPGQYE